MQAAQRDLASIAYRSAMASKAYGGAW